MKDKRKTLHIRWLHDKYANFQKDKIYIASATFCSGKGENRSYTDFRIIDEDGEYHTLSNKRNGKDFVVCE